MIDVEFAKGQNGSDLMLTLFKQVAREKDTVITDITLHFIWDATRLLECSTAIAPPEVLASQEAPASQQWLALRVETRQIIEEDYVCQTVLEQIIVPNGEETPDDSRRAQSQTPSRHPEVKPTALGEPKLVPRTRCSLESVERTVTRYLHQIDDEWVPPNWAYIATQVVIPVLKEGPASCTPIDGRARRLVNRLTARVRRGS